MKKKIIIILTTIVVLTSIIVIYNRDKELVNNKIIIEKGFLNEKNYCSNNH